MTHDEFMREAQKLIETYGEKAYTPQRLRAVYDAVRDLHAHELSSILDAMIEEHQFAPMPTRIKLACQNALNRARERNRAKTIEDNGGAQCTRCGNTGMLSAGMKDQPAMAPFAFRCTDCKSALALNLSQNIVAWMPHFRQTFEVREFEPTFTQLRKSETPADILRKLVAFQPFDQKDV